MSDPTPPWESKFPTPPWESKTPDVTTTQDGDNAPKSTIAYGRGQLPYESVQDISGEDFGNVMETGLMMAPAMKAESLILKGGEALEGYLTRSSPKVAQTLAEGKVAPVASTALKTAAAGSVGGEVYGVGTGGDSGESAGIGAVGGLVGKGAGKGYDVFKNWMSRNLPESVNNKAVQKILDRFAKDAKGGGVSAMQAIELIDEARKTGKEMILPDVSGANIRGISGSVARVPGPGKEIAQTFLNKRDEKTAERLRSDVNKYLSTESGKQTVEALATIRSSESKPLFEEAFRGGSVAPLETQFEKSFQEAASNLSTLQSEIPALSSRVTMLHGKLSQAKDIYQHRAVNDELKLAERELADKQMEIARLRDEEISAKERMRQAQSDRTANAPGAVWNPRIQRLLELPIVKKGINQGVKLEKQDAASEFRTFNAHEYAIVGEDAEGNAIVGAVPNMKLLASAKEGLDSILDQPGMRDELTGRLTKEGVSVDKVRRALLKELKDSNPAYAKALDTWAGHSNSMRAVNYGRKALSYRPEDITEEISDMSPSEKEFAKTGIADTIREKIAKTGIGGDEAAAIIKNDWTKSQIRPFFSSDKDFNAFVKSVTDERAMFNSKKALVGNSATTERLEEDAANGELAIGIGKGLMGGGIAPIFKSMWQAAKDSRFKNERLNEALARILFNPNVDMNALKLNPLPSAIKGPVRKSAPLIGTGVSEILMNPAQHSFNTMLRSNDE